jgi:hypothetical protein
LKDQQTSLITQKEHLNSLSPNSTPKTHLRARDPKRPIHLHSISQKRQRLISKVLPVCLQNRRRINCRGSRVTRLILAQGHVVQDIVLQQGVQVHVVKLGGDGRFNCIAEPKRLLDLRSKCTNDAVGDLRKLFAERRDICVFDAALVDVGAGVEIGEGAGF